MKCDSAIRIPGLWIGLACLQACNVIPHSGVIGAHAISGHVSDADTGQPIPGATICVRYDKLGLAYYVRGMAQSDVRGAFEIPAAPESVGALESPDSSNTPMLSVLQSGYAPVGIVLSKLDQDRVLEIEMHRLSAQHPDSDLINCSPDAR